MLPSRALLLINDFSKPLTRPEWRTMRKMTNYDLYNIIKNNVTINPELIMIMQTNMWDSIWYKLFINTQVYGLEIVSECHYITIKELLKMDGMREAAIINTHRMECIRMKRNNGYI